MLAPSPAAERLPLLKLMTMLSPAFPVGSFSYSHGLEWLIDGGRLPDAAAVEAWIADLLTLGSGWNDGVLRAEAWRAAEAGDAARLAAAAELGEALAASRERRLETSAQGAAFLAAVETAWPCPDLAPLGGEAPYPVAVGAAAALHGIVLADALAAYLNALAANLVSVAVRLVPLGQRGGLAALAALHPVIAATAGRAEASSLADLGSATLLSEIAAMRHETQYSRVFRT
jgi:urease accessory protein